MADKAGAHTATTLNGFFKDVFGDGVNTPIPEAMEITNAVKFNAAKRLGEKFVQPVRLTRSHGFTYDNSGGVAFELNAPIASVHKEASLTSSEIMFRTYVPYKIAQQGVSSAQAFANSVGHIVKDAVESASFRNECSLLYGSDALALTTTVTGSSTTRTFTFADADFAPYIWAGSEGAELDAYTSTSTKVNINAAIVITSVNLVTRAVAVSGNSDDLTAVDALSADDLRLYWRGSFGKEMTGLVKIASSTGSLFGVDGSVYGLWQGNTYGAGSAALSLDTVGKGMARATAKGAKKLRYRLDVNPKTFEDLNGDASALRAFDASYGPSKGDNGFESITYYCTAGKIEIVPNAMMRGGIAVAWCPSHFSRMGSTDLTFQVPGSNRNFLSELPDHAGYSMRTYTDQALFCEAPGLQVYFNAIVNS